jgi:transposase
MSQNLNSAVAVIGIDIGKNSFHMVGLDSRGAIVLRQKWSRGQVDVRLANMLLSPPSSKNVPARLVVHPRSRSRARANLRDV